MVDRRDKVIVEKDLSATVVRAKKIAEISYRTTNQFLTRMSRPGIAIDVSKLRDAIGRVITEFQQCELH
jgi:hypothetical protein